MKRISWLPYLLVMLVLLGAVLLFVLHGILSANPVSTSDDKATAYSLPTPPPSCHYCPAHLLSASPEEIGQFAVKYATDKGEVTGAPPQVMFVRHIMPEDYSRLGLGCPPSSITVEQPPLALVILKGDLRPKMIGTSPFFQDVKYIAYVFDLWADAMTSEMSSVDGGAFRLALNDPTLPSNDTDTYICPTPVPYKKMLHYGDAAPGFDAPPPLPRDIQEHLEPTPPPTPRSTDSPEIPRPIGTPEGFPTIPLPPSLPTTGP